MKDCKCLWFIIQTFAPACVHYSYFPVTPVSYYNIILIFQPLAPLTPQSELSFHQHRPTCKVLSVGKVIVFGRMSAISCGPLNSGEHGQLPPRAGWAWTLWSTGDSDSCCHAGPPPAIEDWGLAPASPLILDMTTAKLCSFKLDSFVCEMESRDNCWCWHWTGSPLKIFKLTLFSTVQPLKQGSWVMASNHSGTFCCHSESQPFFWWAWSSWGSREEMRLQKLTAKTNPNFAQPENHSWAQTHIALCDCVWNSPPLPVRGL